MATSGTVGVTVISTNRVIEHALRRAGIATSSQTPEIVQIAKECLYLLLTHYSNTSLNLWCVEPILLGLNPGQIEYPLPVGTNDLLNVGFCTPWLASGNLSGNILTLDTQESLTRVGVSFSTQPVSTFTVSVSGNGIDYTDVATLTATSLTSWVDLDPAIMCQWVKVTGGTVSSIYAATGATEIPIYPLNRDQYAELPNKTQTSATVVNYQFRKTLNPTIALWPVPSLPERHLALWIHRQVEDVGGLSQTLAIPQRWFEATIIQLAFRLSMEIPGVAADRIKMLLDLSTKFNIEVTNEETDSAPTYVQPGISPYTK